MIRRAKTLNEVIEVLHDPKVTFYYGKGNVQDEITREKVGAMSTTEVKELINNNLIIRKSR